jgi:hypothetical protein
VSQIIRIRLTKKEQKTADKDGRKKGKIGEMEEEWEKEGILQSPSSMHTRTTIAHTMPFALILCTWKIWTNLIKSRCHPNLKRHIIWKGSAKGLYIA